MGHEELNIESLTKQLLELRQSYDKLKADYDVVKSNYTKALEATKENENRYSNLYRNAPISYQSLNINACILDVNPTWLHTLGYNREEVIGHSISEFITPESVKLLKVRFPNLIKNGEIHNVEFEMIRKDGEIITINLDGKAGLDEAGNFKQTHCVFSDITQRKQAELKESETEISYRELFNKVGDAIYVMDKDSTFLDVNDGALKMYGYPREILVGKNPLFVSAPGKNDMQVIASLIDLAYTGEPQQFEFWGLRSNGEVFPKDVRIFNGTYFGKKVNIALAQDITERKQAETAILESEKRYRELIELAVNGILLGSADGKIIGANSFMLQLTGRSIQNIIGLPVTELFDPKSLKNTPLRYDLLKKGETVFSNRDIIKPDGSIVPVEMYTKMMPDGTYQSIYTDVSERQKAEETIRISEAKFKSLVESTSDMIWETNLAGNYTYVSPQFSKLLGYTVEETLNKSPFDFINDDEINEIKTHSDLIVKEAIPFNSLVNRYKHKNGSILYFETSGVPVYNNQNTITGYRGISRDITQRFHAERELNKLSLVVEQSPSTIIITNLEGEIEYINPFGCAISGYTKNELIGKKPNIFSSGETPRDSYQELWDNLKSGKGWDGVFHNKKKNGELYWESALLVPMKDAHGKTTNYLGIRQDITKRLQTELELKESEERYKGLFEGSPDAILLTDIETGMLLDANSAACQLLGRSLSDIRKLHFTKIHPESDIDFTMSTFQDQIQSANLGLPMKAFENIIMSADGNKIPVEVLASPITLNGRKCLQGVFRDITRRKKAQEELIAAKEKAEASDRLKTAFLSNISHELRTPLNGIIGFSEMLTQMDNTEQDRQEFSKLIKKSSARLINTITSYIDISMIVSGFSEVHTSIFNLKPFMKDIYNQANEICQSRNQSIEVIINLPEDNCKIETDQVLLAKILYHLLDNASKFTKKGTITIGHVFNTGIHQFYVKDTGEGIQKESTSMIYESFVQKDDSISRGHEGSGLGLSIARGFVKILGGEIWVDSVVNEGSTFFFTVPIRKDIIANEPAISYNLKSDSTTAEPLILVAEDDDSNYKFIEIILKKASFKVIRATDGNETLEICRNNPAIKLVITDLKMPNMDGFEATRQIRQLFPDMPVIVSSAYVSSSDETKAYIAGCNEFLIKPISRSKLLETINSLLNL